MPEDQLPNPAGMSEVGIPLIAPMHKIRAFRMWWLCDELAVHGPEQPVSAK